MENLNALGLAKLISQEGINVSFFGNRNFKPKRLRSVKHVGTIDSVVYYTGNDPGDISHLYECLLICNMALDIPKVESANLTVIRTDRPKLSFAIVASQFEWPAPDIKVGIDVTVENGVVLGKKGIGYVWGLDGKKWKMPQIGGLIVEDGCFIGANSCIAHGALEHTIIGSGTMLASGVSIGHNCQIGRDCFIGSNSVLGGSVEIGDCSWVGLGAVINPQIKLGGNVVVGSGAVVTKSFKESGIIVAGNPAKFIRRIKKGEKLSGMPAYEVI